MSSKHTYFEDKDGYYWYLSSKKDIFRDKVAEEHNKKATRKSSLPQHPDKTVALVESEKTAIICSAMMPQYLWLATGGKSGLTSERLSSLKGRKIIVFPDIDAFKDWQQKIFTFPHLDIRISRLLEDNATPADRAAHIDLADWILKYLETDNN